MIHISWWFYIGRKRTYCKGKHKSCSSCY